jgi:hypothetical protein
VFLYNERPKGAANELNWKDASTNDVTERLKETANWNGLPAVEEAR